MNVPVYIHPRHSQGYSGRLYEKDYALAQIYGWPDETVLSLARLIFSGTLKRHPKLNIVAHHLGGGMIPFFMGRLFDKETDRQLIEDTLRQFKLIYYDTAIGLNAPAVRMALDVLGTERIVFASDVPWGTNSGSDRLVSYPNQIRSLDLPYEVIDAIFSGNIRRIIKFS